MKIETNGQWVDMFMTEQVPWKNAINVVKVAVLSEDIDRFQSVIFVKSVEVIFGEWRYGNFSDFANPGVSDGGIHRSFHDSKAAAVATAKQLADQQAANYEQRFNDARSVQSQIDNLLSA